MAPNWKPEPHKRVKARAKRNAAVARRECTDAVWERAAGADQPTHGWCECRGCAHCQPGGVRDERCEAHVYRAGHYYRSLGHVDEIVPKSLGGDPTDPGNCRLLCHGCHFSGPSGAHRITRRASL
jgi:hypothetical protein